MSGTRHQQGTRDDHPRPRHQLCGRSSSSSSSSSRSLLLAVVMVVAVVVVAADDCDCGDVGTFMLLLLSHLLSFSFSTTLVPGKKKLNYL